MKTQVEFKSDKFPPYEGEEEGINPGLWGKRLAEYLQKNLPLHGLKVTCIGSEDWGWMVELENKEYPLWIGCGHQSGEKVEFLCFIEPSKPFIRKWFKKIDTRNQINHVAAALAKVFESDSNNSRYYYSGNKISQFVILANAGIQSGMDAGSSPA